MTGFSVADLAERLGGTAAGDVTRVITGVSTPRQAGPSDLVFVSSARYRGDLESSLAGAALLPGLRAANTDRRFGAAGPSDLDAPPGMAAIYVSDPALAMARAIDLLVPSRRAPAGVSGRAIVGDAATIAPDASIGPGCSVGDRTRIGERTQVHAGSTIGADVVIGDDCLVHSGVHVYDGVRIGNRVVLHSGAVIGADGFGFVREPAPDGAPPDEPFRHRKMRQIGTVVIEDDVEIGANTTIDRATLHETRVGRGTKIDNLVTIGHNCVIGRHCVIVGQAGISGSTELGDYATIAGQAGLVGHIRVGDGATVGSQAGVTRDVPSRTTVLGSPAVDVRVAYRALPLIAHLPELRRLVRSLERRLEALETDRPG